MSFRNYITEEKITIYDNGGESVDQYTVIIGNDAYGMSDNPTAANGFNQYAGEVGTDVKLGKHLGKIIKIAQCPKDVQKAIKDRMKE